MSEPGREWQGQGRRFLLRLALVGALAWGLGRYAATRPAAAPAPAAAVKDSSASEAGATVEPSSAALESPATGEAVSPTRP